MAGKSPKGPNKPSAYRSAADLPSYRELAQQIQRSKLLTLFFARRQHKEILEIERQTKRLMRVIDDFYERLGRRNWIFYDVLSIDRIEQLLAETSDAESAEEQLHQVRTEPSQGVRKTGRVAYHSHLERRAGNAMSHS